MSKIVPSILAGLTLLLPFVYWPGLYDFTRWPRLLTLQVLLSAACISLLLRRKDALRVNTWTGLSLLYFLWAAITTLWATNPVESLLQMNQLFSFVILALLASTVRAEAVPAVALAWALAGAAAAWIGIAQYQGLGFAWLPTVGNPSSTFGYRNFAASYTVVTLPVAAAGALVDTHRIKRLAFGASAILLAVFLIYTRTRGAWVGLVVASVLTLARVARASRPISLHPIRKWALPGLALIAVTAAGSLPERMETRGAFTFDERKTDVATTLATSLSATDARGRLTVWKHTAEMWLDHPFHGVGIGSWPFEYPAYDRGDWITRNVAPSRPHNDWLWSLAETGLVGFALRIGLVAAALWAAFRFPLDAPGGPWALGLATGVLALTVHACFSFPNERVAPSAMWWMALGMIASLTHPKPRAIIPARLLALAAPLLVIGALLTLRVARFDASYMQSLMALKRSDWTSAAHHANTANQIGPFNYRAFQVMGAALHQLGRHEEARDVFERSLTYHPNEGHLPLAQVYEALGANEAAAIHFAAERRLFPRSYPARIGEARALLAIGQRSTAVTLLLDARALTAHNPDELAEIGTVLRAAGSDTAAANTYRMAIEAGGTSSHLYTNLGHALDRSGQPDAALEAYRGAVAADPTSARHHNNLGAAFAARSQPQEAEAEFREAIRLDPDYARTYFNLGDLLAAQGDAGNAILAYREFVNRWRGDNRFSQLAARKIRSLEEQ